MTGGSERSHYQVLGVTQGAAFDEIRRAHRQLARVLHPDRMSQATPAERSLAERRMREVNAAWTVLSDVDRRRAYDRTLQVQRVDRAAGAPRAARAASPTGSARSGSHGSRPGASGGRPWDDDDLPSRADEVDPDEPPLTDLHFWLLRRGPIIAALVVALGLFVVTAYAGGDDDGGTTRTTLPAEDCVRVRNDGRSATRTTCTGPHDGEIVTRVDAALDCPAGTKYVVIEAEYFCVDGDAGQPVGPTPAGS